jgi:hypothetical protein
VSGVDLVQWLRAQLDEDERIARAATLGPWVQSGIGDYGWTVDFGRPGSGVETADTDQGLADADFIAAHNPARVLREIDAKRATISDYEKAVRKRDTLPPAALAYRHWDNRSYGLLLALRHAAAVYAGRPGYAEATASGE